MAISYTQIKPITELLNAFNNEVIKFTTDTAKTPTLATLTVGGVSTFQLTPINGVFTFNLKEVLKYLSKLNEFKDNASVTLSQFTEGEFIKDVSITFEITFSDDTTESDTRTFNFIRGVKQIGETRNLTTDTKAIVNHSKLTFFKGYPFDVSINPGGDASITVTNTNSAINFTSTSFTSSRLYLSNGESISGDVSLNPILSTGYNTLTFDNSFNISVKLLDVSCGVYLKWINEFGTWSYWLFNRVYKSSLNVKANDTYMTEEVDIDNAVGSMLTTGKEAVNSLKLRAEKLNNDEVKQLRSILTSPRVEIYTGNKDTSYLDYSDKWQIIIVNNGTFEIENTKRNLTNFSVTISKTFYTQK